MSRYTVYVLADEFRRIKQLPEHLRQRVKHAIDGLAEDPRPTQSKKLDVADLEELIDHVLFVVEFKVGETEYISSALDQVCDYALDLKNFHETSRFPTT